MSEVPGMKKYIMEVLVPENLDFGKVKGAADQSALLFKKGIRGIQAHARLSTPLTRDLAKTLLEDLMKNHRGATVGTLAGVGVTIGLVAAGGVWQSLQLKKRSEEIERLKAELDNASGAGSAIVVGPADADTNQTTSTELEAILPQIVMTETEWRQLVEMRLRLKQVDEELARLIAHAIIDNPGDDAAIDDRGVSGQEIAGRIAAQLEMNPQAFEDITADDIVMLFIEDADEGSEGPTAFAAPLD